jgi:hypothetical protein
MRTLLSKLQSAIHRVEVCCACIAPRMFECHTVHAYTAGDHEGQPEAGPPLFSLGLIQRNHTGGRCHLN